jgi:hypothetical protein
MAGVWPFEVTFAVDVIPGGTPKGVEQNSLA